MAVRGKVQDLIVILIIGVCLFLLGGLFIWLAFKSEHGLQNFKEYIEIAAFYIVASVSIIIFAVTMLFYNKDSQ